ncbi:MAG: L-2-hydroxyglutarate oxidase [Sedimentisphaerales bacterium]|nr:L-2-hydroxyglutarate oxidase [Sedimentisphaerales bacterium]
MVDNNEIFDIVIVGGGIVGLASAYKIASSHPDLRIAVMEKEKTLCYHQTGHNSGVIHSGLYYKPGSAKAMNCTKGRKELVSFAKKYEIPHKICGKIIVATANKELTHLERIYNNGLENQVEGIEKITSEKIKELEPFCDGIAGLWVPCTGIIDFVQVAEKLAELIVTRDTSHESRASSQILLEHEVTGFDKHDFYTEVRTNKGNFTTKYIINCAGLQSDRIAKADGIWPDVRIIPFRGDFYELTENAKEKVNNLIYPVPDPKFPFLGVHFTRMINDTVECGPNAVFSFKREGYNKTDFDFTDLWESLSYMGTWTMFMKNLRFGIAEYSRAFSKKLFLHSLQRLVPSLTEHDIKPSRAGVRAQAVAKNGKPVDDFKIEKGKNSIHVLNAPSPAATASLAIGEYINEVATQYFKLKKEEK